MENSCPFVGKQEIQYAPAARITLNPSYKLITNMDILVRSIILTGFIEELVFRGFILQKLMNLLRFWTAYAINGILFALFHIPFWFISNTFNKEYGLTYLAWLILFGMKAY